MKQARLVAIVNPPTTNYSESWRHPMARTDWLSTQFFTDLGRLLERGRFDMVFLADALAIPEDAEGDYRTSVRTAGKATIYLDPIVALSHISAATEHLGLGATMSTTFQPAYSIARAMLTLDHLSGGRAAWNIVTSTSDAEARNYGMAAIPGRDQRYDDADEVVTTVLDLMHSWEADALVLDGDGRVFADPDKVHRIPGALGASGTGASVAVPRSRGPIGIPHGPQGHPVLMQAGASPRGLDFAAKWAEVVFANGGTPEMMREQRSAIRERAAAIGRDPDSILYLPAIVPIVGASDAEAQASLEEMLSHLDEADVLIKLSRVLRANPDDLDPDGRAVDLVRAHRGSTGSDGFESMMEKTALDEDLSVRDFAFRQAFGQFKFQPVGSPSTVADALEDLLDSGAADGFVVSSPVLLRSLQEVVDGLVPELQRRGRLRTDYEADTLRGTMFGSA